MSRFRFQVQAVGALVGLFGLGCSDDGGASGSNGSTTTVTGNTVGGVGGSVSSGSTTTGMGNSAGGVGAVSSNGSATTGAGANREVLSCSELETKLEADGAAFDIEVTLGVWENVPAELKVLPQPAELCGSLSESNQGLIASELGGAELEAYYVPVLEGLGCPSLECDVQTEGDQEQYVCACFGSMHWATLTTAPDAAYYLLAYE